MIYLDKCSTGTLQSWTIRSDSWIGLEILAHAGCTSHLSHTSISSIPSSLSLIDDRSFICRQPHTTPSISIGTGGFSKVRCQFSPSLITLLPASSRDGVFTLLWPSSLLLCGLFAIVLLGVLGRGGFFFRNRRSGLVFFNLRGGLGMPFFTGKYGDFLGLPCCLTFAFV